MTLCLKWLRVCALASGIVSLWIGDVSGQAPESDPPRTSWGAPDLQGVWDFRTITPLERPEDLADREFLTEEQAAAYAGGAVRLMSRPIAATSVT